MWLTHFNWLCCLFHSDGVSPLISMVKDKEFICSSKILNIFSRYLDVHIQN